MTDVQVSKQTQYSIKEIIHLEVLSLLIGLKAAAMKRRGVLPLRTGPGRGLNPFWGQIKKMAPECFRAERSEQWVWEMMDSLRLEMTGGLQGKGERVLKIISPCEDSITNEEAFGRIERAERRGEE